MYKLDKFTHLRVHSCINIYDKEFVEPRNHHETYCATTYPELCQDNTMYIIGVDIDPKYKWYKKHFELSDNHLIELEIYISMGKSNSVPLVSYLF